MFNKVNLALFSQKSQSFVDRFVVVVVVSKHTNLTQNLNFKV